VVRHWKSTRHCGAGIIAACTCLLGACTPRLAVTPYVMRTPEAKAIYAGLDPALQTPEMQVIYLTDRAQEGEGPNGPKFGFDRSISIAYGTATVSLDPTPTWETLVAESTSGSRSADYALALTSVSPRGRFTPMNEFRTIENGVFIDPPSMFDRLNSEASAFGALVEEQLSLASRKEVVLFVHGFNNSFDEGVIRIAQAWHLAGRLGVPVVYSWPAGSGIFGYGYDRESGEFTIVHLKRAITALSHVPGVEKIHIVAHSRGTDVLMTALRELNAEARGIVGLSPYRKLFNGADDEPDDIRPHAIADMLKLETVVLAAPDLDVDVFTQRVYGENSLAAARRTVIYYSGEDEALAFARWIFGSKRRLGLLSDTDLDPAERELLNRLSNLEMISCEVSGYTTHAYMFQHPAALSDMIRVLRDGARPGAEHGRPLKRPEGGGFWILDNGYMLPEAP
jgi:esterase/lipase superfamily enzyme